MGKILSKHKEEVERKESERDTVSNLILVEIGSWKNNGNTVDMFPFVCDR